MFEPRSRVEMAFGLSALGEVQRRRSALAAVEADLLVALAGSERQEQRVAVSDSDGAGERTVTIADAEVDLVAASLHRSPTTVRRQVAQSRLLCTGLPATRAALMSGRISEEHAEVIVRTAVDLPAPVLPTYERQVVAKAACLTPGQTGTLARRVRARVDRMGEEARRAAARRHEDVRVWVEGDGLACLHARLPIADAARVHAALDERARAADAPCDATLGQRRVRGLVEALCGKDGESSSVGVQVQVTVDLATLAGLADASALVSLGHGVPEPITAPALRELLGDPSVPITLRRLVTDPATGALIDRGRTAYRVNDSLRAFLVARDGTCRFPGCTRAAITCDIDHAEPWRTRGATDRCNLGPLCRRHHVLKTHAWWRIVEVRPDGRTVWSGPDGREYVFHPFPVIDPPDPPLRSPAPPDPVGAEPPFPF
jgi:hypothetical protein